MRQPGCQAGTGHRLARLPLAAPPHGQPSQGKGTPTLVGKPKSASQASPASQPSFLVWPLPLGIRIPAQLAASATPNSNSNSRRYSIPSWEIPFAVGLSARLSSCSSSPSVPRFQLAAGLSPRAFVAGPAASPFSLWL